MNKILIGLSWPYANGEFHIGHLGSSLPADILARYYRLKGEKVCFVSGSDCYGTPISIQAQQEGKTPQEIAEKYHLKFVDVLNRLDFSLDNYSKTNKEYHINFAKEFHKELYKTQYVCKKEQKRLFCEHCNRFLPDRYVVGFCPDCHNFTQGDSCDKCGKILEPEDLLEPKCKICDNKPVFKDNFQYYLKLTSLEEKLKGFYGERKNTWSLNAVNLTERYIQEGLQDRAISRDLDWGVPVPVEGLIDKVIYNWGENVLGYISACKEWCDNNGEIFEEWFENNTAKHIYIHAKDNIPFHSIIFPSLLLASERKYHLPDKIFAYEYVTNDGQKISKSKGTCLTADQLLKDYDVDFLRFYFSKNISDRKDLDFSIKDFTSSVNGELINNWGNFVNRTLSFIRSKFDSFVEKKDVYPGIEEKIKGVFQSVCALIECGKVSNAIKEIFELVDFANKFFHTTEPWNVVKVDQVKCKELCYQYLILIANLAVLLNPFIPRGTERVLNWIGIDIEKYNFISIGDTKLGEFYPLYTRILQ